MFDFTCWLYLEQSNKYKVEWHLTRHWQDTSEKVEKIILTNTALFCTISVKMGCAEVSAIHSILELHIWNGKMISFMLCNFLIKLKSSFLYFVNVCHYVLLSECIMYFAMSSFSGVYFPYANSLIGLEEFFKFLFDLFNGPLFIKMPSAQSSSISEFPVVSLSVFFWLITLGSDKIQRQIFHLLRLHLQLTIWPISPSIFQ